MGNKRNPTLHELRLIEKLIGLASVKKNPVNWKDGLLVEEMNDGKMGSLLLFPVNGIYENRLFGGQLSEYKFIDSDGVEVFASLNLDQSGEIFELDIWKTDFSPLIQIPDNI